MNSSFQSRCTLFASLFFLLLSIRMAHAEPIISMRQIRLDSQKNTSLRIDKNKVRYAHLEIQKLRNESSVLLQGRIKGGAYKHFTYTGINKHYISRPDLGIKYYLFGGNKYQKHIIAEAEPKYYDSISTLDSARRRQAVTVEKMYVSYWRYHKISETMGKIILLSNHAPRQLRKPLHALLGRIKMQKYLSKMQARAVLTQLREHCNIKIPRFRPVLPAYKDPGRRRTRSIFYRHPGLEGLVHYYRSQKRLGWLRFIDLKFKLFARPSYYPSAGRTKMAVIGGVYLTMPIDIFGAVHREDQQLSLNRQNILLRLDAFRNRILEKRHLQKIRTEIFKTRYTYWKGVAGNAFHELQKTFSAHKHAMIDLRRLKTLIRTYRRATIRWVSARSTMASPSV